MTALAHALLLNRSILRIGGPEKKDFLQGLITNDVEKLSANHTIYAALLTPQGKILADFFLCALGDDFLLDCDQEMAAPLLKRLTMYKLRAQVTIEAAPDLKVAVVFGEGAETACGLSGNGGDARVSDGTIICVDPRYPALGLRIVGANPTETLSSLNVPSDNGSADDYLAHRLTLGVAEGLHELGTEQMFALEANLAELNGVDFSKGCYVGQELTARMKHKTTLRKRIVPLISDQPLPPASTPVTAGDRDIGTVCAVSGDRALGLLRLDRLEESTNNGHTVQAGDATVTPKNPPWLTIV